MTPPQPSCGKPQLRRLHRQRRSDALKGQPDLEQRIVQQVRQELERRNRQGHLQATVGLYWPLPGEVDLRDLRQSLQGNVALPATDGEGGLSYHHWGPKPLAADSCGIPAPLDQPPLRPDQLALLLVPALAIDHKGLRLGYGGGYYDRLRAQPDWRRVPTLAVLPELCAGIAPLPDEAWDVPVDGWICETGCTLLTAC